MGSTPKAVAAALFAAFLLLPSTQAAASCGTPRLFAHEPGSAPSQRPQPPDCLRFFLNSFSPPKCDEHELRSYKMAVESYLSEVDHFVEEARNYASAAAGFARDAEAYAACEERELDRW